MDIVDDFPKWRARTFWLVVSSILFTGATYLWVLLMQAPFWTWLPIAGIVFNCALWGYIGLRKTVSLDCFPALLFAVGERGQ